MSPPTDGPYGSNYCLFEWTDNGWIVVDDHCEYGNSPSEPEVSGEYIGQLIPTPCQPT